MILEPPSRRRRYAVDNLLRAAILVLGTAIGWLLALALFLGFLTIARWILA